MKNLVIEEHLVKKVHEHTLIEINSRMGAIEQVSSFAIATLLDLRFQQLHFQDQLACTHAISKIKGMIINNQQDEFCTTTESNTDNSDKISMSSDYILQSDQLIQRNWKTDKTDESLSDELSLYLRPSASRFNENPLAVYSFQCCTM